VTARPDPPPPQAAAAALPASLPHHERGHRPSLCASADRPWILAAAILASALGFIDGTLVAIALPAMRGSLDASLPQAQWISNAYMLALCALILAGGAMGDRFGLVRVFASGIALFLAASLACAAAPTAGSLIAARALQGIGAALMVPGSLALVARAYPADERGRAIGIWAAASAVTTALGPVLGGLLLTLGGPESWRALFAVNLPLGGLALWLILTRTRAESGRPGRQVDWPGAALATLGLGALALALTGTGEAGPRAGAALLGLAALAAFLWVQHRSAAPMMPLAIFADRAFSAANAVTFLLYFALSAMLFFLPMTVIAGWGVSEIGAAAAFAPLSACIGLLSARTGRLADRIGPDRPIAAGAALVGTAYAAMALAAPAQAFWPAVVPAAFVLGLGMALVVAPLSAAVMASAGEDAAGTASGINNAVARMAGLIAVAAMGPVAAAAYASAGGPESFGAQLSEAAAPAQAALHSADVATDLAAARSAAHSAAMSAGFATVAGTAALLAFAAAGLARFGLRPRESA